MTWWPSLGSSGWPPLRRSPWPPTSTSGSTTSSSCRVDGRTRTGIGASATRSSAFELHPRRWTPRRDSHPCGTVARPLCRRPPSATRPLGAGCGEGTRTPDLPVNSRSLCQFSYSEAALQAAALAARPHPHDGSGRGGPTAVCSWHLCTGGWSLRGDVRGTCPRSPCTVPAMCADVSPSAASRLTAPAVLALGRMVVSWPVAPVLAGSRRSWRSPCRRSSPGGVLPIGAREGVDGARPIGLGRDALRTDAGFEGAPHQRQHEAVLASHRDLGPGCHRKVRSWLVSGERRVTVAGKEKPPRWRRLLEDCDWVVAAYEDASGAGWPALAYEERPSVRPMTGSTKQRSWRRICLLVRGSIELGSLSATQAGGPGARLWTPLRRMQPTAGYVNRISLKRPLPGAGQSG